MRVRKLLAYTAIYILWGGSFLAIREIVAVVPPFFAAGFRFTLAGLILLIWSRLTGPISLGPRQLYGASILGLIMFTCLYAGLFWAEIRIASGVAAIISAMIPVWIFAGEVFLLRTQRATALSLTGIALGFLGVVVLAVHSSPGSASHTSTLAVFVTVAGTICWSAGTLLSRRLALPRPQKANAGWQMFSGGFLLLILAAATGDSAISRPPRPSSAPVYSSAWRTSSSRPPSSPTPPTSGSSRTTPPRASPATPMSIRFLR